MGATVGTFIAGSVPQRVEKLICLDGFVPMSSSPSQAEQLAKAYL
jgi:hypothetical protein